MQLVLDNEESKSVRFSVGAANGGINIFADGDRIGYFTVQENGKVSFVSDCPIDTDTFNVDDNEKLSCF